MLRYPAPEGLFAQPVMRRLLLLFVLFPVVAGAFDKAGLYSRVGATNCPDYVKNFDEERAERLSPDHIRVDRLASQGVMFEDAFSSTNITNPSHAALMTALSPRATRMVNNNTVLSEQAVTLAERYQEAGYFTLAALSAGHMNHRQSGLSQGFDRLWVPRGKADVDSRISIGKLDEWLAQAEGLPLFVWLHVFDAHAPYQVPDELRWRYYDEGKDPYDESLPDLPPGARVPWDMGVRDLEYVTSQYMSEVTYLDSQLEGFLSHPRFQNAIIAITGISDCVNIA